MTYDKSEKLKGGEIEMKKKLLEILAGTAFIATLCNVNAACFFWVNQPKVPDKAKKLRRF